MKTQYVITMSVCIVMAFFSSVLGQDEHSHDSQRQIVQIQDLEARLDRIESKANRAHQYIPFILILFGAFSALWAQNTGRNPWLWFFLGYVFCIITVLVVLAKNPGRRQQSL